MGKKASTIALRLAGGIGNQLFQVMAALLVSRRTGQQVAALPANLKSHDTTGTPEVFRVVTSRYLDAATDTKLGPLTRWMSLRARAGRWIPLAGINDQNFPEALMHSHRRRHVNFLDGYFQRGWTNALLAEALAQIHVVDAPGARERAMPYDCLMHIRGGDFLNFKSHSFLDTGYYERCLTLARNTGCQTFGIVTDDPAYAGQIASQLRQRHAKLTLEVLQVALDPLQDFATLRHARHRIIGNSTFAWWACALDEDAHPTWSPDKFIRDTTRDFFLAHERTVASAPYQTRDDQP